MKFFKNKKPRKNIYLLSGLCLSLLIVGFLHTSSSLADCMPLSETSAQTSSLSLHSLSNSVGYTEDDLVYENLSATSVSQPKNSQRSVSGNVYSEWNSESVYTSGNTVLYQGFIYRAKWWTQGEQPGTSDVWENTGKVPSDSSRHAVSNDIYPEWNRESVYTGGNTVLYQGFIYRAKWWTQGEQPGTNDVWENTGKAPAAIAPSDKSPASTDMTMPAEHKNDSFRVVGYFPSWKPQAATSIRYDVLTHVIYAFAIPTAEGSLLPLENADTAVSIIQTAHQKGVKVLLAVGGWSYNGTPLENTFMQATATSEKRDKFAKAILDMCDTYGFDGIDMDWEHPRVDGTSASQYESLMMTLADALHKKGKILTSAVLSGATADGNIYYDAAAHSDTVLNSVDWINVMAYDGGDGDRHSQYNFAVQSAQYWKDKRKMPRDKVVLGVPFYARPSWAGYGDILSSVPNAWNTDCVTYNGMQAWYNGMDTIRLKTRYALENLGGLMIWEISQDTSIQEKSLMTAIQDELNKAQP